jgi:hypothetical protein
MTPAAPSVRPGRASTGLGGGRSAAPVSRDSQPISTHGRAALQAGGIQIAGASATGSQARLESEETPMSLANVSSNAVAYVPPPDGPNRAARTVLAAARIRAAAADDWHGEADRRFADRLEERERSRDLPAHLREIGAGRELVNQEMRDIPGLVDTVENPDYVAASASRDRLELANDAGALSVALDAADTIKAGDSLEKMAVHQMAAVHACTMRMIARLNEELETCAFIDPQKREAGNVRANRLAGSVARLMGAYQSGMLALQRKRSGGQQHVKVTHVHQQVKVEPGSQAIVAGVATRGEPGDEQGEARKNDL